MAAESRDPLSRPSWCLLTVIISCRTLPLSSRGQAFTLERPRTCRDLWDTSATFVLQAKGCSQARKTDVVAGHSFHQLVNSAKKRLHKHRGPLTIFLWYRLFAAHPSLQQKSTCYPCYSIPPLSLMQPADGISCGFVTAERNLKTTVKRRGRLLGRSALPCVSVPTKIQGRDLLPSSCVPLYQ